jgi:Zn-dependent protease/predicted transcriptional regulator
MFRNAFRLPFRLAGIPLYLDISFLIVLPLMIWLTAQNLSSMVHYGGAEIGVAALHGPLALLLGLVAVVGLFASVVLHELGHSLTARRYGVQVRRITLWFLGGVAEFEEMPRQRGAEAVVAIAGPLVSFALAGIFWTVTALAPLDAVPYARLVTGYLYAINLMLGVFNLLPAMPMDGGRILRSLLAMRLGTPRATVIASNVAKVIAVGMGILGLMGNLWLILLAFFVFNGARAEAQQEVVTDLLKDLGVADLMNRDVRTVPAAMPVGELTRWIVAQHHQSFPVVDDLGRVIGTVGVEQLRGAHPEMPVWQVMSTQVQTVPQHAGALDAFRLMGRMASPRLVVLDDDGRMVGILSQADLARAIQVRMMGFQVVNPNDGTPIPVQVQRVGAPIYTTSAQQAGFGYTNGDAPRDPQRYARPL